MKIIKTYLFIQFLFCFSTIVAAQSTYPVTYTIPEKLETKAGASFSIHISFNADDPWYIYAPTGNNAARGMIETNIIYKLPKGITRKEKIQLPKSKYKGGYESFFRTLQCSAEIDAYSRENDTCSAEMTAYNQENDTYRAEMNAYSRDIDAYRAEMNPYSRENDTYNAEIDAYSPEIDNYIAENSIYSAEKRFKTEKTAGNISEININCRRKAVLANKRPPSPINSRSLSFPFSLGRRCPKGG